MIKKDGLFTTAGVAESDRALHTPGDFAKQNLLYVQEVGRLHSLQPHRCVRENVDSFLFMIVLEGKGNLFIDGRHYSLSKGNCALIDCMEHYEHISDEQDAWTLAWVHFNGQPARGYYDMFLKCNKGENVFTSEDTALWNEAIGALLERQKDKRLKAELECGELLIRLLNKVIYCVLERDMDESVQERHMISDLRELLNERYADVHILQDVEKDLGRSIKELNGDFQHYYGIDMVEYICNRRFNAAKEMLRFSVKSIEQVALESGIYDIETMQQMFVENEGMTAEEYRAKWAGWIR